MSDTSLNALYAAADARKQHLDDVRQAARKLADRYPLSYWRECDKIE